MAALRDKAGLTRESSGQDRQREGAGDHSVVPELRHLGSQHLSPRSTGIPQLLSDG